MMWKGTNNADPRYRATIIEIHNEGSAVYYSYRYHGPHGAGEQEWAPTLAKAKRRIALDTVSGWKWKQVKSEGAIS